MIATAGFSDIVAAEPVPVPEIAAVAATRVHEIEALAGTIWQLRIEQNGSDTVLFVAPPGRSRVVRHVSRMGSIGHDFALLEAVRDGHYRIWTEPAEPGMPPGTPSIQVEAVQAHALDTDLLEAMRAESEANRLLGEPGPVRREDAMRAFDRAARAYLRADRQLQAADTLFSLAALQNESGDPVAALATYDESIAIYQRHNAGSRLANAQFAAGAIRSETGQFGVAADLLQRAIAGFSAAGNELEAAQARNCLCLSYHRHEQLERARACYTALMPEFERLGAPREQALVLNNLGGVLYAQQRNMEAAERFAQALAIEESYRDDGENLQLFRNNVALAARRNGDYQRALALYLRNAADARRLDDKVALARALNNAGFAYFDIGEMARADSLFRESLELRRQIGDRAGAAVALNNLAMVQRLDGELDEARTNHMLAREIALGIESTKLQAGAEVGLARIALERGEANEALTRFSAVSAKLGNAEDRDKLDEALHGAGLASMQLGRVEDAARYLSQALALRERLPYPAARTETLHALARLDAREGRFASAATHLDKAMRIVEATRADLLGPEMRASYLAAEHGVFELKTELLMRQHALEPARGFDRQALATNERARARSLLEQIATHRSAVSPRVDPALLLRERALGRQLAGAVDAGQGENSAAARDLSDQLRQVAEDIREADPGYASMINPEPLDVDAMQATLGEDVTLVQFALGDPYSYLWVVDETSVQAFTLPSAARISELATRFYSESRVNNPAAKTRSAQLAAQLGEELLGAARPYLKHQRLVIVADGMLHYIPFAALASPDGTRLIEEHELVYAPSVSAVAMQRSMRTASPAHTLAIVADPVLAPNDERMVFASAARAQPPLQIAALGDWTRATAPFERLQASGREASAIAAMLPENERLLATGYAARRSMVVDGGLASYKIIHFATHGLVDSDNPLASGLALSRYSEAGNPQPGFLSLADLGRLDLSADLVVLSACDTALGKQQRGEGLIGLTRGFMRAGAGQVLASAWQISDRVTADFMEDFYRRLLLDNASVPAALRASQIRYLAQRNNALPYFWAAFSLTGDWR